MINSLILDDDAANADTENPFLGFWMDGDSLAPPCQAEMDVVDAILDFGEVSSCSCVYDMGCGDGRICLRATQRFGCTSVGCEIEDKLVKQFCINKEFLPVEEREKVRVIHGDLREIDTASATVIVIYLLPEAIELLKPQLIQSLLRPGVTLICNTWGPKGFIPVSKTSCGFCNNVNLFKYDISSIPSEMMTSKDDII